MSDRAQNAVLHIFVASDGTGGTAEGMTRAAIRQFGRPLHRVRGFPNIVREEQIERVFRKAQQRGAVVVTTLVQAPVREAAERLSTELGVPHIDLIGPLLQQLETSLGRPAAGIPGLLHNADDNYFERIAAVEYTMKVDDGKEPRLLLDADIVLTGVSRTSKTPLSTFLAHKGYKVANVPLVLDREPPMELFEVDPRRVFALTISPEALSDIRASRIRSYRLSGRDNYSDPDFIMAELDFALDLFSRNPEWPVIDVTNKAIEETASRILQIYGQRGFDVPLGDAGQL